MKGDDKVGDGDRNMGVPKGLGVKEVVVLLEIKLGFVAE